MVRYPKASDILGACGLKGKGRRPAGVGGVWRGLPDGSCGTDSP